MCEWLRGAPSLGAPFLGAPSQRTRAGLQWIAIFFAVRRAATNVIDREFRQRDRPRVPPEAFARAGEQPNFFDVLSAISVGNRCAQLATLAVSARQGGWNRPRHGGLL